MSRSFNAPARPRRNVQTCVPCTAWCWAGGVQGEVAHAPRSRARSPCSSLRRRTLSNPIERARQVVDMFGCGLPVCAAAYACIGELVAHGDSGLLFSGPGQLAGQLARARGRSCWRGSRARSRARSRACATPWPPRPPSPGAPRGARSCCRCSRPSASGEARRAPRAAAGSRLPAHAAGRPALARRLQWWRPASGRWERCHASACGWSFLCAMASLGQNRLGCTTCNSLETGCPRVSGVVLSRRLLPPGCSVPHAASLQSSSSWTGRAASVRVAESIIKHV